MKLRTILTLILGLVVVVGVAGFGLLQAFDRAHSLRATKATIESDVVVVGTAFAGSISEVSVAPGDKVASGDELFRLQSPTLQQARETSRFNPEGVGYRMSGDDTLVYVATGAGTVGDMPFGTGSFVPANTQITSIQLDNSLRVRADLALNAADYGRMPMGSTLEVTLPTRDKIETKVYEVSFEDSSEGSSAVVRARGEELSEISSLLNGSPVTAEVQLEPAEGVGAWAARQVGELLTPRGY